MNTKHCVVRSIGKEAAGQASAWIDFERALKPQPGQIFQALPQHAVSPALRHTLYPTALRQAGFRTLLPRGERWQPGDHIDVWGPIGPGFSPPAQSRNWLLAVVDIPLAPLRPLLESGRSAGLNLAVVGAPETATLPVDVEVLASPAEARGWADYIAAAVPRHRIDALRRYFQLEQSLRPACPVEVMLVDELGCGFGVCRACAVSTSNGWRLCCSHGPIFPLDVLRI